MCAKCQAEYDDPLNRRFHAEPNACPECGPGLALIGVEEIETAAPVEFASGFENCEVLRLERARRFLEQGRIVAVKGLGGFHLACDASSDRAVGLLRERKRRNGKAFAIMARDLKTVERLCVVTDADRALLVSFGRLFCFPAAKTRRSPFM